MKKILALLIVGLFATSANAQVNATGRGTGTIVNQNGPQIIGGTITGLSFPSLNKRNHSIGWFTGNGQPNEKVTLNTDVVDGANFRLSRNLRECTATNLFNQTVTCQVTGLPMFQLQGEPNRQVRVILGTTTLTPPSNSILTAGAVTFADSTLEKTFTLNDSGRASVDLLVTATIERFNPTSTNLYVTSGYPAEVNAYRDARMDQTPNNWQPIVVNVQSVTYL